MRSRSERAATSNRSSGRRCGKRRNDASSGCEESFSTRARTKSSLVDSGGRTMGAGSGGASGSSAAGSGAMVAGASSAKSGASAVSSGPPPARRKYRTIPTTRGIPTTPAGTRSQCRSGSSSPDERASETALVSGCSMSWSSQLDIDYPSLPPSPAALVAGAGYGEVPPKS